MYPTCWGWIIQVFIIGTHASICFQIEDHGSPWDTVEDHGTPKRFQLVWKSQQPGGCADKPVEITNWTAYNKGPLYNYDLVATRDELAREVLHDDAAFLDLSPLKLRPDAHVGVQWHLGGLMDWMTPHGRGFDVSSTRAQPCMHAPPPAAAAVLMIRRIVPVLK